MKYLIAPFAALALTATVGNAAPFQVKNIAADAKWVIHVDVDAVRGDYIVKKAFETCPMLKDSGKHFDMGRDKIGIDLRKDLHGITLYGPDSDKKHAVVIVFSTVNKELLLEKAKKASDHKVTRHGGVEIHSWTMKHGTKSETAAGAFYKNEAIVFASDAEQVGKALDVLAGKSSGIADSRSPLSGRVRGATVIVRASEIPDNVPCEALKQVKSFRIAMGENEGKSFFRERIVMKSPEAAEQIKTIGEGFKAMAALRHSGDAEMMKLINGASCTVRESTVNVRWEAPVEDVWTALEKMSKKVEAHIKKMKEMHKDKNEGKDKDNQDV
jgi:ribosome-associated translation inhibitor RaiA